MKTENIKCIFKRITAVLMATIMLLCVSPLDCVSELDFSAFTVRASTLAETGRCGDNVTWNYNSESGELVISGTGDMWDYNSYSNSSPFCNIDIKIVIVESGVTSIGEWAFYSCNLESVIIGNNVESVDAYAFDNCTRLKNVTIPNSVTSIGVAAFENCSSLDYIMIPDNVTSIGIAAFGNCTSLEVVSIPYGITIINDSTFENCFNLVSVSIPDTVTNIGDSAFYCCECLTSITISDSVTFIGDEAFFACKNLENVIIPTTVTSIGNCAFQNCTSLEIIKIPSSVTSIGNKTFYGCSNLESVTFNNPECQIYDSDYMFPLSTTIYGYKNSTAQAYAEKYNRNFVILLNVVETGYCGAEGDNITYNLYEDGTLVISGTGEMEEIKWHSSPFSFNTNIKKVIIENGITNLCSSFYNCTNLESVTISESVTNIGYDVFNGCTKLKSVTFPESVTNISGYAFYGCSSLISVNIPKSVTSIGGNAFYGCSNLESVTIKNPECQIYDSDRTFSWRTTICGYKNSTAQTYAEKYNRTFNVFCPTNHKNIIDYEPVAATCTEIGYTAGQYCNDCEEWIDGHEVVPANTHSDENGNKICDVCGNTTTAIIKTGSCGAEGDNVTYTLYEDGTIVVSGNGDMMNYTSGADTPFYNFISAIKSVVIEDGVNSIGVLSFYNCYNLESVTISNTVSNIESSSFASCTCLTNVTIPDSVINIGDRAFENCSRLSEINISDKFKNIGLDAFYKTKYYETQSNWEDKMLYLGKYLIKADTNISGPCEVKEGTLYIAERSFSYCFGVESIRIPDSITNIGCAAFFSCGNLKYVFYNGSETDWNTIHINESNENITEACIHYNSLYCSSENIVSEGAVSATCSEVGYTDGVYCNNCEDWISGHVKIDAINHKNKSNYPHRDATCTENGYTAGEYCPDCEEWIIGHETIESQGHAWINATCESPMICINCQTINGTKLDHKWEEATCLKPKTCLICGQTQGEARGHDWKSATCIKPKTCANCNMTDGEAIGHTPVLNNDGSTICNVCNAYIVEKGCLLEIVFYSYKNFGSIYYNTDSQNIEMINWKINYMSFVSNQVIYSYKVVLKCNEIENTSIRLTGSDGYIYYGIDTYNISVIEHTIHKFELYDKLDPTCTETGYAITTCACSKVNKEEFPATGHSWEEKTGKKICSVCGLVEMIADNSTNESTTNPTTHPSGDTSTEPTTKAPVETTTKPVESTTNKAETTTTQPTTEPTTKVAVETTTKPVESTTNKTDAPATQPSTEPTTKAPVETTTKPVESTTKPAETTKPSTESTTKPSTEPTTKPSVEETTKPSEEPTTHTHKIVVLPAVKPTYKKSGKTEGKKCSECGTILAAQKTVARKKLKKVTSLKKKAVKLAKGSKTTLTLSWKKVTGAEKYVVQRYINKKWKTVATTKKTSYTVKKLKGNKSYKFRVRAVVGKYKGAFSKTFTAKTTPLKPTLTVKAGKKQLTASWKKVANITGYEVQYSTSKKFTKKTTKKVTIKKAKTTKKTVKKLRKGKKYFVRVRAYKTVNGKKIYGSWSTVKSVKVK